jgi:tRNA-splicing ligase RtcB (3'-phosphate/5'-hydroxy nucleic acid ligase)
MAIDTLCGDGVDIRMWIPRQEVEQTALEQLHNVANLPWIRDHVAVMPDVHAGAGSTIGTVIASKTALMPAAVGVDVGCGMRAVMTDLRKDQLPDLVKLREAIEDRVPTGFNSRETRFVDENTSYIMSQFSSLAKGVGHLEERAARQLGTLGGGNHFIEVSLDTQDKVWVVLHSGSRNIGNEIARTYIAMAKEGSEWGDLSPLYVDSPAGQAYLHDAAWAQMYALVNRSLMMTLVLGALTDCQWVRDDIDCHHNYVTKETHDGQELYITRKGAISARLGQIGIIPGSMGAKTHIVRGLGNKESYCSASHGAGRRMSRSAAKKRFTVDDIEMQLGSIECRRDAGILDELPGAYKDIDQVMEYQRDLVEVVETLNQVLCIKG